MGYHRVAGTSRELGKVRALSRVGTVSPAGSITVGGTEGDRKRWGPDHGNLSMALPRLLGRQELSALPLPICLSSGENKGQSLKSRHLVAWT